MTSRYLHLALASATILSGCGLENLFSNMGKTPNSRPASTIQGFFPNAGVKTTNYYVSDGGGITTVPFDTTGEASGNYQVKLPSSAYSMVEMHAVTGDTELRAIVPSLGVESSVTGVDLDAKHMTEALIVEARLSATGGSFKKLTPSAYAGTDGLSGTRGLIWSAMNVPGPTQDLYNMVKALIPRGDPNVTVLTPYLFGVPVLDSKYNVTTSPIDSGWIGRNPFDYVGDGVVHSDSVPFDQKLGEVAQLYKPEGCPDPAHIRLMFTVDFNDNALNGNCGSINKFKWAKDAPNKTMFFVGWIFTLDPPGGSQVQDSAINTLLGASTPNTIKMYDDGTNGDEVAGDNIYTVVFDVPYDPSKVLRIGYKYTWGTFGAPWSGSEEWPGNSRILEVVDVNGDGFVYKRDVFSDEATNKDFSNLNLKGNGTIGWTTDLHGCGIPEAREQPFTVHNSCACETGKWHTPQNIGPITVACTGP